MRPLPNTRCGTSPTPRRTNIPCSCTSRTFTSIASKSSSRQAVLDAEVGQLQPAYDSLGETALIALHGRQHSVRDGVHIAPLAGAWIALVAGFGGLRLQHSWLSLAPRLPDAIERLAFHLVFRARRLRIVVTATEATYHVLEGSPLKVRHHGEEILLPVDGSVTRPIPPLKAGPRPTQPPGRAPIPRQLRVRSTGTSA